MLHLAALKGRHGDAEASEHCRKLLWHHADLGETAKRSCLSLGCADVTLMQSPFCPAHKLLGGKMVAADQTAPFCCLREASTVLQKLLNSAESFCNTVQSWLRQQNEAVVPRDVQQQLDYSHHSVGRTKW